MNPNELQLPIFFQDLTYSKQMEVLAFYGVTTPDELGWGQFNGQPVTILVNDNNENVVHETVVVNENYY